MENEITTIPVINVDSGIKLTTPSPEDMHVSENDPALTVMTDFTEIVPVTVGSHTNLHDSLEKMKAHGVRLLLILDENDNVTGVLTAYDIQSEKPIKYGSDNDIPVNKIEANMLMTPIGETPAFDFDFVKQSLVRHVVETMKELNRPHTLVIENDGEQKIRGVFSTSKISKMLGRPVYQPLHAAHSFADIQNEVGGS